MIAGVEACFSAGFSLFAAPLNLFDKRRILRLRKIERTERARIENAPITGGAIFFGLRFFVSDRQRCACAAEATSEEAAVLCSPRAPAASIEGKTMNNEQTATAFGIARRRAARWRKRLQQGGRSTQTLVAALEKYLAVHNKEQRAEAIHLFIWTATAKDILAKVTSARKKLSEAKRRV